MARMTAGLDAAGMPLAWHVRMTGNSIWGTLMPATVRGGVDRQFQEGFLADMPYDIPNYLADYAIRNTHVPVGFWRCVNHTQNCFFKESFVDEMAHAAGIDPFEYRRHLIGKHRHAGKFLGVLDAAAERAGWDDAAAAEHLPRHCAQRGLQHLRRGRRRNHGRRRRRGAHASHRLRARPRHRGQSADRRDADRKRAWCSA